MPVAVTIVCATSSAVAADKVQPRPDTNVLLLAPSEGGAQRMQQLLAHLRADGVLASSQYRLRMVPHLDVSKEDAQRAVA